MKIKRCCVCGKILTNKARKYCNNKCLKEGTKQRWIRRCDVFKQELGWDKN